MLWQPGIRLTGGVSDFLSGETAVHLLGCVEPLFKVILPSVLQWQQQRRNRAVMLCNDPKLHILCRVVGAEQPQAVLE